MDGLDQLLGVATGQIGASDRPCKEGVSREQQGLIRNVEADAALGMAGSRNDGGVDAFHPHREIVGEVHVGRSDFRRGDAQLICLDVHHGDQWEVALVVEDGCAGDAFEALRSRDVVYVGVGYDDLLDGKGVLGEKGEDAWDFVAGIDYDGFAGGLVAEDGAVALEGADGEGLADHGCAATSWPGWRGRWS